MSGARGIPSEWCGTLNPMTGPESRSRTTGVWHCSLTSEVVAQFTSLGWTADDWRGVDELADDLLGEVVGLGLMRGTFINLREWLRQPPAVFKNHLSPALVRETLGKHDLLTSTILDAYAAGASARFVDAFLAGPGTKDVMTAWAITQCAHLSEPEAVGWALTGRVKVYAGPGSTGEDEHVVADRITWWAGRFGPTSYLLVLAGFTFDEAAAMQDAGRMPAVAQLRVMAALNGHVLPAGV